VGSLLDEIEDLDQGVSTPPENLLDRLTWLVSCALASGKALGFGADMLECGIGENKKAAKV
jgi:hypothetical protein